MTTIKTTDAARDGDWMTVTFTLAATSEAVQAAIDEAAQAGEGLTVLVPWNQALRSIPQAGDPAVLLVAADGDQSSWIGTVEDVWGKGPGGDPDGYDVEVTLDLM
jgi:hypothetical protein